MQKFALYALLCAQKGVSLEKLTSSAKWAWVRFQDDIIEMFLKSDFLQSVCELERYARTTVKPKN